MEKTKSNKRNRNRKFDDEGSNNQQKNEVNDGTSDKYILKSYLDRNIDEISASDYKKLKIYIDEIKALLKNRGNQNFEGLVKLAETNV
jgi:hypothetical protein